mgnify:FL=1
MNKIPQLMGVVCLVGLMFGLPAQAQLDISLSQTAIGGDCDTVYAVHDDGLNDTQFVTIGASEVKKLEPLGFHPGLDIEGLDVSSFAEIYASSGDDTNWPGHLYEVDPDTGEVYSVGDICFNFPGDTGEALAPGLEPALVCAKEVSSITFNQIGRASCRERV